MPRFRAVPPAKEPAWNVPWHTEFFDARLDNEDVFGPPRVESTFLQAAVQRIAEHFVVYDALDQLLSDGQPPQAFEGEKSANQPPLVHPSEPAAVKDAVADLDDGEIQAAKDLIFSTYMEQNQGLVPFIEHASQQPPLPTLSSTALKNRLHALLGSSEPGFVGEIATALSSRGTIDTIQPLDKLMRGLMEKGHYLPAQVILDSVVMSHCELSVNTLHNALDLAVYSGRSLDFSAWAAVLPLPRRYPDMSSGRAPFFPRSHDDQTTVPAADELRARFADLSKAGPRLAATLCFGFSKFRSAVMLDRALVWAEQADLLTERILRRNVRTAEQWKDPVRGFWSLKKIKPLVSSLEYTALASRVAAIRGDDARDGDRSSKTDKLAGTEAFSKC